MLLGMTQAFWDDVAAPAWVAEQDALDRQLVPHDDALLDGSRAARRPPGRRRRLWCGSLDSAGGSSGRSDGCGRRRGLQPSDAGARRAAGRRQRTARQLPRADLETWSCAEPVDAVVSRLGLTDSPRMLAALRGLLRPGGRLVATVFRDVSLNEWMLLPTLAVAGVLPVQLPPPGAGGPFALADPERTTSLLHDAGFVDVHLAPLDYDVRMTGPTGGGVEVVLTRRSRLPPHWPRPTLLAGTGTAAVADALAPLRRRRRGRAQGLRLADHRLCRRGQVPVVREGGRVLLGVREVVHEGAVLLRGRLTTAAVPRSTSPLSR